MIQNFYRRGDGRIRNLEFGIKHRIAKPDEKNIFIREISIKNLFDRKRKLKIYFNQQFNISQTHTGETAYYDPRGKSIVHYKGRRVFLINALFEDKEFDEYSVGLLGIEGCGRRIVIRKSD